jgi:hypothetical protein
LAVARRDQTTAKKSWLEVKPVRLLPGEPANVELMAFAADGAPRTDPTLTVQWQGGGKADAVTLTADPEVKGRYTGKFTPGDAGDYRLTYAPEGAEPAETTVPVAAAPGELRRPNVNRAALEQLAADSKGKLVELWDLASVADLLQGEAGEAKRSPPPAPLWDNWVVLTLLVFLYSLDVGLRRLRGLS